MTVNLEHPIFDEADFPIHAARLAGGSSAIPGAVEIRWIGDGGEHSLFLLGNEADDFVERHRAAPDPEAKEHILIHEIRKAAIP